jgi:hypothetical protein
MWIVSALRKLAYEERNNPESMAHGLGRALLDAAGLLERVYLDETAA